MAKSSTMWDRILLYRVTLLNALPTRHPERSAALLCCVAWALSHVSSSSPGEVGLSLSPRPFGLKGTPLIYIRNHMASLHFTIFRFFAWWLNIFIRNYIILFTSSLLSFNYIFALIWQNQDKNFFIFSYMLIWSFIISYTSLVYIFPFRKKIAVLLHSY